MKLQLTINGKSKSADFSQQAETVVLKLEASTHEAQLVEPQPGLFTLLLDGKVYACTIEKQPNGDVEVIVNGQRIPVTLQDPKRLSRGGGIAGQSGGRATLISPMPGKVVRILLAVDAEVSEGQGVLIVEAMKMQNEVQSPKDGKVASINVTEGQTVNAGDTLAVIE
ncbi:MAG: biotin/lipoyl-binding protein [Acidobacteria bacterium]|nr:biotin/lipoyl-binding protein [Acidobacteriota bacterium]